MTVESASNKAGPFNAAGSSGTFPRDFLLLSEEHLRVIRVRDGGEVDLTTGIGHTGIGTADGTVVVSEGIQEGDQIYLLRAVPNLQRSDYSTQGRVRTDQVEKDLDLTVMQVQDIRERQQRAVTVPVSSELDGDEAMLAVLAAPGAADRAERAATISVAAGNFTVSSTQWLQTSSLPFPSGAEIFTRSEGLSYRVVDADPHMATAGGVMLRALPDADGWVHLPQFGVVYGSRASAAANATAINRADAYCRQIGARLDFGAGVIFFADTLIQSVSWRGAGNGFWPAQPAAIRPLVYRAIQIAPTQLVAVGTFPRVHRYYGVSSMAAANGVRTNGSPRGAGFQDAEYRMLSFMDPATGLARGFSVAVLRQGDYIHMTGMRIVPDFGGAGGLDGYEDPANGARSTADVDVGLWHDGGRSPRMADVDVVGHWRMAGCMIATLHMDLTKVASPYHVSMDRCALGGFVGLAMRGSDQYRIMAVGANWIEVPWADDIAIRDPAVWPYARITSGGTNAVALPQPIISVTNVASRARITFAAPISGITPGQFLVAHGYGGANSHFHSHDLRLLGFHLSNGAMAHDGNFAVAPFPSPSKTLEVSGWRSVETVHNRLTIQTMEEVAWQIHDHRFLRFDALQVEAMAPVGISNHCLRAISFLNGGGISAGQTADLHIGGDAPLTQAYLDLRPAVPMTGTPYAGDGGYCNGSRVRVPGYTGSENAVGPYLRSAVGGTAGIKRPGYLSSADVAVYNDTTGAFEVSVPVIDRTRPTVTGVTGAGVTVEVLGGTELVLTVNDDAAATIALSAVVTQGSIVIAGNSLSAMSGHLTFRATTSGNYSFKLGGAAAVTALADTALSGTTGADGDLTFSAGNGLLYLENRTGAQRVYRISLTV